MIQHLTHPMVLFCQLFGPVQLNLAAWSNLPFMAVIFILSLVVNRKITARAVCHALLKSVLTMVLVMFGHFPIYAAVTLEAVFLRIERLKKPLQPSRHETPCLTSSTVLHLDRFLRHLCPFLPLDCLIYDLMH